MAITCFYKNNINDKGNGKGDDNSNDNDNDNKLLFVIYGVQAKNWPIRRYDIMLLSYMLPLVGLFIFTS